MRIGVDLVTVQRLGLPDRRPGRFGSSTAVETRRGRAGTCRYGRVRRIHEGAGELAEGARMSQQVLVDPALLVAEGDVLWAIGHRVEASVRTCEAALASTGGMAGDEDVARIFALGEGGEPGYDGSARQVLEGALGTVNALRAMDAALANTARAYDGAQLAGAYRAPSTSRFQAAEPSLVPTDANPPSALGPGPTTPLGEFGEFLTDALATVGVMLPDAAPGKIDAAETAWTELAAALRSARREVDAGLHAAVSPGVPQHARIAGSRDGIARRLDTLANAADGLAGYARALGDAIAKAWEEIGWLIAQMVAEIALEIGVGVALSFVTAGLGAVATAAKVAFTVGRWAIRIAEVCHRLAALMRGALAAARIPARGAAQLALHSVGSGISAVAAQIGYNEVRAAVDPGFDRQGLGEVLAGGMLAAAIPGVPGPGRTGCRRGDRSSPTCFSTPTARSSSGGRPHVRAGQRLISTFRERRRNGRCTSKMKKADIITCILREGLDDWVMIDRLIGLSSEWSQHHGDAMKQVFHESLTRLVTDGLAIVGDLRGEGFTDWTGEPFEVVRRVERELDEYEWNPRMAGCWLRNTDKGDELGRGRDHDECSGHD